MRDESTASDAKELPLLSVRDLVRHHVTSAGVVQAVDGVTFTIDRGEVLGLVGESGCGKSTLGRTLLGLDPADSGSVRFQDTEVVGLSRRRMRPLRRHLQMIFQDPFGALNPRSSVERLLIEPFAVHGLGTRAQRRDWARELLVRVGLRPEHARRFPHQFSGGQRQRIGIARAIALRPQLIVCDEAVSALDVSVQAQIVNLLRSLQCDEGLAYLFISHDLGVVAQLADRIAVMYLGRIVEIGAKAAVLGTPAHPYTQALFAAVPGLGTTGRGEGLAMVDGEPPSPLAPPPGCRFHTRCPRAVASCSVESPELRPIRDGQQVACHLA